MSEGAAISAQDSATATVASVGPPGISAPPAPVQRVIGRPFVKGQSGNPSGRRKVPKDVKAKLEVLGSEALDKLADLMRTSKNDNVRLRAAEILVERWLGKSMQRVEFTLEDAREIARTRAAAEGIDPELAVAAAEAIFRGESVTGGA